MGTVMQSKNQRRLSAVLTKRPRPYSVILRHVQSLFPQMTTLEVDRELKHLEQVGRVRVTLVTDGEYYYSLVN